MPKHKKRISQTIIAVKIVNYILEEVFDRHPDIVSRAIARVAIGDLKGA